MQQKKLIKVLNKIITKNYLLKLSFFLIAINALCISTYSGYKGILPIDSFLIFNSGYNVINNIHPFKDYWSITGPLLDYLQALFFVVMGVNWHAYVLHASLINVILSLTVFYLFINLNIKLIYSLLYSISIGVLAYTSIGTPFVDHHAAIFSTISVSFAIIALNSNREKFWFVSAIFLTFSFFSKQIPSVYLFFFLFFILLIKLIFIKKDKSIIYFIIGSTTGTAIFLAIFLFFQIPLKEFLIQYIYYPNSIGENRTKNLNLNFKNSIMQFKFIYIALLPMVTGLLALKKKEIKLNNKIDLLVLFMISGSIFIFIYTQLLTKNQVLIFFLIPWILGLSHYYLSKYYNKKFNIYILMFLLIITTIKYHIRFNEEKKFMEFIKTDFKRSINAKILDERLNGLKWITPKYSKNPMYELNLLKQTKKIIRQDQENKIIITDYLILPAIIGNTKYAPNKWFDEQSVPKKRNIYFNNYKIFFNDNLKKQEIKNIYIVGGDKKYISFLKIFGDRKCTNYKKLNEITIKLSIKKCKI